MNPPIDAASSVVTIPSFQIDPIFLGLFLLVGLIAYCQWKYPEQMALIFHVPDGVHGVTAMELILFRILLLISLLHSMAEILNAKLK